MRRTALSLFAKEDKMQRDMFSRPSGQTLSAIEFDLIVTGGGITGAGIAQDAALRGLSVLLLDKGDFASGTSSKSTKLIHGGLRYLANGQVSVVLESVRERQLLMKLAPHMVWSLPFVIPRYRGEFFKHLKLGAGLWIYDLLAGLSGHRFHKSISAEEVLMMCPGVRSKGLTGGFLFEDCRTDDARHTLEVIKSACENGAVAINYAEVVGFVRESGYVSGVKVKLRGADEVVSIAAKCVINATGVWTEKVSKLDGQKPEFQVVPAKGIHIVVDRATLPIKSAMIVPSVHDKRFCFAVPWYDAVVIGTTDTEYDGDLDNVRAEPHEIQYVLDAVNALFPNLHLTAEQITGSYAGLRPLVKQVGKGSTADLSRKHTLTESADGLITIAGGKLTTYRPMAREAVDLVVERLSCNSCPNQWLPCETDSVMLGGFDDGDDVAAITAQLKARALALGLNRDSASYLPTVYGKRAGEVLDLVEQRPLLAKRLVDKHPYIDAQVVYAVRCEGALTLDDVLARRVRLTITDWRAATDAASKAAELMADELTWNKDRQALEVAGFVRSLKGGAL
jgi:glycerol-3-phosphate dehydrogenase